MNVCPTTSPSISMGSLMFIHLGTSYSSMGLSLSSVPFSEMSVK